MTPHRPRLVKVRLDGHPDDVVTTTARIAAHLPTSEPSKQYPNRWDSGVRVYLDIDPAPDRPRIVCLCGSTRFRDSFNIAAMQETLAGRIVLGPGVFHHDGDLVTDEVKADLDELHRAKIRMADEVLVVDVSGYVGPSTAAEIAYAHLLGKPVRYMEGGE